MNHVWNLLRSAVDSLPDLANIVLAVVGVWMSFPKKAQQIEDNPRLRKSLAATCLLLGMAAFFASRHQRQQFTTDMQNLVNNTNTSVGQLKTVVTRTGDLTTNTNNIITSLALLVPQMTAANARIADLDVKINAAKEKHDPKLIADLQAQAASARQFSNSISKDILLSLVSPIVQELRNWEPERAWREQNFRNIAWNQKEILREMGASLKQQDEVSENRDKEIIDSNRTFRAKLESIMANADSLRQLMLQRIPQASWTAEDRDMDRNFKGRAETAAANYLEQLAKRI